MGLGDGLMASGEVKELRKKNPTAKFIIGDGNRSYWNEVFDYNTHIIRGSEAKKYEKISFQEVLNKGLNVMDMTAFTLSKENKLPIVVFDMNKPGNLIKIIKGDDVGTLVTQ